MSLIHLPQTKWGSGTGRQVILKGDFDKIEQAVTRGLRDSPGRPAWNTWTAPPCGSMPRPTAQARVMLCGFPSPLHRGHWVDGGLSDGRYRENAAPVSLDLATPAVSGARRSPSQWYAVYALAGASDAIFYPEGHAGDAGGFPGRPGHHPEEQRQWG